MDAEIHFTSFLPPGDEALGHLSAEMAAWFRLQFGEPTPVQRGAFPIIAKRRSALISAPTGTGKTLAALLPLLQNTPTEGIGGIIITPLKALAADQVKNLRPVFEALAPAIRIGVRTGDTSAAQRRLHKAEPPQALWTTPESLATLLTQDDFRRHVATLRWVVVDEIHALASSKRGSDLVLSLERLEDLAHNSPLQRVGLSATCEPLAEVARFLVGDKRPCHVVAIPSDAKYSLTIEPLPDATLSSPGFVARVVARIMQEIAVHRTTLIFANTRGLCERIGWALQRRLPERVHQIATHHSSLAPERRREIETQLKEGRLAAVVSSASLELGIDIGSVDGVVFVHPPGDVARLLQRLGRAGHQPGAWKRGLLLCSHASEILEAGVTAASGRLGQLEPIAIPSQPLDVLCQHLVAMGIGRAWTRDSALSLVRRAYPYRNLTGDDFDACVRYLRGQNPAGDSWLPSRIDNLDGLFTVTSRRTARLIGRNLGTIVSETPRLVRVGEEGVVVGELDESYAAHLQPGDRFLLDGRCLTLQQTDGRDLIVRNTPGSPLVPRWQSGFVRIPETLARRLYMMRAEAAEFLRDGAAALHRHLARELGLGPLACEELAAFVLAQETASEVPHHRALLIEVVDRGFGFEYALHTPLHSAANEALARVVQQRMMQAFGGKAMSIAVTLGVVLFHETDTPLGEEAWRQLLDARTFPEEIGAIVQGCDLTRTRFAHIARTGLMVLRQPLGRPRKVGGRDWIERRLFDQLIAVDPDFALIRQARRETRDSVCDAAAAYDHLQAIALAPIAVRCLTEASPIASAWLDAGEEAVHKQWHEAG